MTFAFARPGPPPHFGLRHGRFNVAFLNIARLLSPMFGLERITDSLTRKAE
jgi:hypothetical protein